MKELNIKFRGLTSSNEWVYGDLIHDMPNDTAYYSKFSQRISWGHFNQPVKNGTVCMSSGLNDISDKEIYSGDIVYDPDEDTNEVGLVLYDEGTFYVTLGNIIILLNEINEDVEIIGNIHDNPELLSKED